MILVTTMAAVNERSIDSSSNYDVVVVVVTEVVLVKLVKLLALK